MWSLFKTHQNQYSSFAWLTPRCSSLLGHPNETSRQKKERGIHFEPPAISVYNKFLRRVAQQTSLRNKPKEAHRPSEGKPSFFKLLGRRGPQKVEKPALAFSSYDLVLSKISIFSFTWYLFSVEDRKTKEEYTCGLVSMTLSTYAYKLLKFCICICFVAEW